MLPCLTDWTFVCVVFLVGSTFSSASRCYANFGRNEFPSCIQLFPNISLHWSVRNGSITWAADVDGAWDWVGLGVSEAGMLGADMAIARHDIAASQWTASDYWSSDFSFPQLDQQQDVTLVSIAQQYGSTQVAMRRPLVTCDAAGQDRPILNDTLQTFIFAYGAGPFAYHGTSNRGEYNVMFIPNNTAAPGAPGGAAPDLKILDIRMTPGFVVPTSPTTYQCVNLALPNATKYHLYRYEPLIDNSQLVHHFVAYSCRGEDPPPTPLGQPYDCLRAMECEDFYIGWAPGVGAVDAPALAALPFGAGTGTRYLSLQIHYTNLGGLANQTDSSGFRLTYSPTLKKYDMGVLTLGSYEIAVPPGAASWSTPPNVCPAACTAQFAAPADPGGGGAGGAGAGAGSGGGGGAGAAVAGGDGGGAAVGLTLVQSFYHMHQLGRSMVTRHVRGGVELPPLGVRDFFRFDYQSPVGIPPGTRQLLPGDVLITTCTYTGAGRTNVTSFGLASYEEMCFNFLTYYPYNASVNECIAAPKSSPMSPQWATCTTNDVLNTLDFRNSLAVQAASQAGQLVEVPGNLTFKPYQPTCTRSAPAGYDDDDDDDDEEGSGSSSSPHHRRNVGGAVAAILIVTFVGAVAIVVVYRVMKKKQQAEEEKHLFEKYNPNSMALPLASYGVGAKPDMVGSPATGGTAAASASTSAGAGAEGDQAAASTARSSSLSGGLALVGGAGALGKGYSAVPSSDLKQV